MELIISNEAEEDLKNALSYFHEKVSHDVAQNFYAEWDKNLNFILANPEIGSLRLSHLLKSKIELRYFVLSKFNYYIFYSYNQKTKTILILRVMSNKRDIFNVL